MDVKKTDYTVWIPVLTIAFLLFSMWNIYEQHKYRKMDYFLKTKEKI